MDFNEYENSIQLAEPPPNLSVYLQSLWYDGKDDWDRAHEAIQDVETKAASWIHAYLHRKEGDLSNAGYWYNRAGRRMPVAGFGLDEEWENLVNYFLNSPEL